MIVHQTLSCTRVYKDFCIKKWDLGTNNTYVWLLSFHNGPQGSYAWWWCTTKKWAIQTETPFSS